MKKKIVPDVYFFTLLLLSILFHIMVPISKILSYPYTLSGILIVVCGFALTLSTNAALLKQRTSNKPNEIPTVFLTSGPFRLSRNPIYLGMTIILFGVEVLLGSLSPLIFPIIFVIIINSLIIPGEENILEKKFGEEYLEYKKRVRRWL